MKKIIATVLAMVMALALCTTAMAATTYGDFYKWDGGWVKQNMDGVSISYTAASESKTDGKLVSATRGYFTLTNGDNAGTYVEVPAADAKYQLTVDGTVKYLDKVTDANTPYTKIGSKIDLGTKCGDYAVVTTGNTLYKDADGKVYVAGANVTGDVNMLVDGKLVSVKAATETTDYTVVKHVFELVSSTKDANGVVTGTAKCKNCTQTANVTNKTNVIPVGYSSQLVDGSTDVYAYWTTSGSTTGTTNTTKPSPKTFDAGIAMYVGIALTSVAGSAVVIGKKKEV